MIYINPKTVKRKEVTDTEKGTKKTLTLAEVENGYIFIKCVENLNEEGYMEGESDRSESVFVYYENPMDKSDEKMEGKLKDMVEKLK